MAQQTYVLGEAVFEVINDRTHEVKYLRPEHDLGPSHICEENAKGQLCSIVTHCGWLERWLATGGRTAAMSPVEHTDPKAEVADFGHAPKEAA
jgi:hypothetical protein